MGRSSLLSVNYYIFAVAQEVTCCICCRFDYTFVCPTEIISFSEKHSDFASINTEVLALSTDSHHTHLAWSRTKREDGGVGKLNIPLVADISKRISSDYGALVAFILLLSSSSKVMYMFLRCSCYRRER